MRILIQKVLAAQVVIDDIVHSSIDEGLVLFVGFNNIDNFSIIDRMIQKLIGLRIFEDENGKTNLGLDAKLHQIMSVSQFTLYADTIKGRRPSFTSCAKADEAHGYYDYFNEELAKYFEVKRGVFQADMKVSLINDGPFTLMLDSEEYQWQ